MTPKVYTRKDLIVTYNDYSVTLNSRLLVEQKINDMETINAIKEAHIEKFKVIDIMIAADEHTLDGLKILHNCAITIENIEFKLQKLWGFDVNSDYHYWWRVPKCICPSSDNLEAYGIKYKYVDSLCPVHGNLPKEKFNLLTWVKNLIKKIFKKA